MVRVKIVGATGYGGIGLLERLLRHPEAKVVCLTDLLDVGQPISQVYPHLTGFCDLRVQAPGEEVEEEKPDVVFFATPDGVAMQEARRYLEQGIKVIDYSGDFRFRTAQEHDAWYPIPHTAPDLLEQAVYGLPELNREAIRQANLVANPGCFAVAALLGWTPAVAEGLLDLSSLVCDAKTGVSGAGKKPVATHHFPARNENMNAYRIVGHRHAGEIEQELGRWAGRPLRISFVPQVVPLTRGIMACLYGRLLRSVRAEEVRELYREFYRHSPFVRVREGEECPGVLAVRMSNFCDLTIVVDQRTERLIVISCLDNLVKGQAGNALQNMNLMFGLDERLGLWDFGKYP